MNKSLLALFTLAVCHNVLAADITIENAWARETVAGMSMGGVFMNINNPNRQADVLIGGNSPVSDKIEIHTHINDNGVMRMREVVGGLTLPTNQTVTLKPGSYHVMLMGLKAPLKAGDTFPLTLTFKHTPAQTVQVHIQSNAGNAQMQMPTKHQH